MAEFPRHLCHIIFSCQWQVSPTKKIKIKHPKIIEENQINRTKETKKTADIPTARRLVQAIQLKNQNSLLPKNCASIRLMTKSIVSQHHVPFFFLIFFLKILFQQQRKQQHGEIRDKKQTADGKRKLRENTYWLMMLFFFFLCCRAGSPRSYWSIPTPPTKKIRIHFPFFYFSLCIFYTQSPPIEMHPLRP